MCAEKLVISVPNYYDTLNGVIHNFVIKSFIFFIFILKLRII